jgi:Uma2 family endonuclease
VVPDYDSIVVQDDTPVDNLYVEKQQRLLTEPLYSSWPGPGDGRPFWALANVGLFHTINQPPFVPDMMLSLDVRPGEDIHAKPNRSYFVWVVGKTPDVVVEIVSDRRGGEADEKLAAYARLGIPYYVIYDPDEHLSAQVLRAFALQARRYVSTEPAWFEEIGLGIGFWDGTFEGAPATWLRWKDRAGQVIPTGFERAEAERQQALAEQRRAEAAEERLRRLEARLRTLGQDVNGP